MNRVGASLGISIVRRHAAALVAILLAGVGFGVGLGALIVGRDGKAQSAGSTSSIPTAHARASGKSLPPASAGFQSDRGSSDAAGADRTAASATPSTGSVLTAGAHASFERLQASLPGRLEIALLPLGTGSSKVLGGDEAAHGWSTTKVPVLTALLKARHEELTSEERSWAQAAITESDNQSVLDLFGALERIEGGPTAASSYMQELFSASGDDETVVATAPPPSGAVTTFGQTEWSPSNAVKFFSALARGCLLSSRGTEYVLGLMQRIEPSESWGLGSAGFASVAFKGGWGPEPSGAYLVRQAGIVDVGSSRAVAVALIAFPPAGAGSFEAGTEMLSKAASWLRAHLDLVPRPSSQCA
jgi:hypothetical protein